MFIRINDQRIKITSIGRYKDLGKTSSTNQNYVNWTIQRSRMFGNTSILIQKKRKITYYLDWILYLKLQHYDNNFNFR